jgi:squalene cyclase
MAEVIRRISDDVFAPINTRPVYVRDGAQRLQSAIRQHTGSPDIVVSPADVVIQSTHAVVATAEQWAAIREIHERLPDAHAVLRHHLLMSRRHQGVPSLVIIGVLVNLKHGPFLLRREYIVSDRQQAAPAPEVDHH